MPIKRRSNLGELPAEPVVDVAPAKLEIVAKPKIPLPEPNIPVMLRNTDEAMKRLGGLPSSCGSDRADEFYNAGDYVHALRTTRNPGLAIEQRYRDRVRNRGTAITGMCMDCQGHSPKAVRECLDVVCPLWMFRLGGDPFRGQRK